MPASIKIPTIFTAVDKFSGVVSQMTKGISSFSSKGVAAVKRLDNGVTSTFRKLGNFTQLALGVGAGAIFKSAIDNNIAFEDSLASVSAITGVTGAALGDLGEMAMKTAKDQKMLGADVLKAYELIGSAKPELLENTKALDEVTRSTILLSKASRMDMASSAASLTDVMNQFNKTGAESTKVVDILAAGAKYGAAAIPDISAAIVQFGTVAKQANVSLEESVAAIEVFAEKGIKGAEAGTKMRNVLTTLATAKALPKEALEQLKRFGVNLDIVTNSALPLKDRLKEFSKVSGDATAMVKIFGKENMGAGSIMLNNIDRLEDLTKGVSENGVAQDQATAQTKTLKFALESIKTAFLNATTATNTSGGVMKYATDIMIVLADNIDIVIGVAITLIAAFIAMKAIILASTVITFGYSVAMGISAASTGAMSLAMKGNIVAQTAFKIAMFLSAAATWIANSAFVTLAISILAATWPILAVIAAVGAIIAIFYYWDDITKWFGEQWAKFTAWISEAWDNVVKFFSEFDFKGFFMNIGQAVLSFLLLPLQGVLLLLSKIPGTVGDLAKSGLKEVNKLTGKMSLENVISGDKNQEKVLTSTRQASDEKTRESIQQSQLNIDIRDKGGNVESVTKKTKNGEIPIKTTSTVGAS